MRRNKSKGAGMRGRRFVPRKLNLKIGRRLRALGLPRYDTLCFAFVFPGKGCNFLDLAAVAR